jgi:hypothetical protein
LIEMFYSLVALDNNPKGRVIATKSNKLYWLAVRLAANDCSDNWKKTCRFVMNRLIIILSKSMLKINFE